LVNQALLVHMGIIMYKDVGILALKKA